MTVPGPFLGVGVSTCCSVGKSHGIRENSGFLSHLAISGHQHSSATSKSHLLLCIPTLNEKRAKDTARPPVWP